MAGSSLPEQWKCKPCLICRMPAAWLLCDGHETAAGAACDAAYGQLKERFEARHGAALDAWLVAGKLPRVRMTWDNPDDLVGSILRMLARDFDEALYLTSGTRWSAWRCQRGADIIQNTPVLVERLKSALQDGIAEVKTDAEQADILRAIMHPERDDEWYEAWQIINDLAHLLPPGVYDLINMRYDKDDSAFDASLRGGSLEGFWRDDLDLLPSWVANHAVTCWLEHAVLVA